MLVFLSAVLVLALVAGAAVVYFSRRWRSAAHRTIEDLSGRLADAPGRMAALGEARERFAALHVQPYVDLSAELGRRIDHLSGELQSLGDRHAGLRRDREITPAGAMDQLAGGAQMARRLKQKSAALERDVQAFHDRLAEAEAAAGRIAAQPVEIAGQARELQQKSTRLVEVLNELDRLDFQGDLVEQARFQSRRLKDGLQRIPAPFYAVERMENQPDDIHRTTGEVYLVLQDLLPAAREWLPRVEDWQTQYRRTVQAVETLSATGTAFRRALNTAPGGLVLLEFEARVTQIAQAAREQHLRLRRPDPAELRPIERTLLQMDKTLRDSVARFDTAMQRVAELDRALLEADADLSQAVARQQEAANATPPLDADLTRPVLDRLKEKLLSAGPRQAARTPAEVDAALERVQAVQKELAESLARLEESLRQRDEIAALLESPGLADGGQWAEEAARESARWLAYHASNWPRDENVAALPRELQAQSGKQRLAASPDDPAILRESDLETRLDELLEIEARRQALRTRYDRALARFEQIRKGERAALDRLENIGRALAAFSLLLRENPTLQELAAAELNRISGEVERLRADLGNPAQGQVERKTARVDGLEDSLTHAAGGWLDRLAAALQAHTARIAQTLAELDSVGNLDDREVVNARNLLNRVGLNPVNRRGGLSYLDAAAELKRWNDSWQECAAAADALDGMAEPVLEAARRTEEEHQAVRRLIDQARHAGSDQRDWGLRRRLELEEEGDFQKLEARLDGVRSRRWTATRLVSELDMIFHEFSLLRNRAGESARAVSDRVNNLVRLEADLDNLRRRWAALPARYPAETDLEVQVKDLLRTVDTRLTALRSQYKRGSVDADQAAAGLTALADELRVARFTVSGGRTVGVAG